MAGQVVDPFMTYMARFERDVLIAGYEGQRWGTYQHVPVRPGRLEREPIGKLIGNRCAYEMPLVLEYFGHLKKSLGFMEKAVDVAEYGIRLLTVPLVNFSTVRMEDIVALAPSLVAYFPMFKQRILDARFGPAHATR